MEGFPKKIICRENRKVFPANGSAVADQTKGVVLVA
jgi:hypothetical protein